MKYFAKIGLNNKVIEVSSVHDNELLDSNNVSSENLGIDFLTNLTGWAIWRQTFKDRSLRKNYAGIGYTYDEDKDAFIAPKPFNSWTLNEETCQWEAPVVKPDDGKIYNWNEETQQWDLINE
tara:strand:+ start:218 stop:583 length:366 start_codon:yes stop_codon:yes gene_type:complete